jgi:hypothetical protein
MLLSHRVVAFVLLALVTLFVLFRPSRFRDLSPLQYLKVSGKEAPEIFNRTLGVC